ncbi:MAG: class I SAM-dependent methyltransferase [Deltaproteobacteria bacterium]|jgi:SAM-dependent methyltransferase|nr:class I SAM-dependent methyltransferase [Deltaproteobacteria bacterium]
MEPPLLTYTPQCRWCGKGPLTFQYIFDRELGLKDLIPLDRFVMERCEACGTFQVNPHPGESLARAYFQRPELYLQAADPDGAVGSNIARAEARRGEYQEYVAATLARLPEGGAILDIGAGTGLALSLFPDRYRRVAVEPNPLAAQKCRERGLDVLEDWAETLKAPREPLCALIFNQSLDHFPRPDLMLGRALNWLAPGGLILLTGLVNPNGVAARITGPAHRLWHPFHQVYPPRDALAAKLRAHGFRTLAFWRPYFHTPHGSCWALAKGIYQLAKAWALQSRVGVPSPPWPGSVYGLLAQKTLLFQPLPALDVSRRDQKPLSTTP